MKNALKTAMLLSCVALVFGVCVTIVSAWGKTYYFDVAQGIASKKTTAENYNSTFIAATNKADAIANPGSSLNFEETLYEYGLIWDSKISTANIVLPNLNTEVNAGWNNLNVSKKHLFQIKGTQNGGKITVKSYT